MLCDIIDFEGLARCEIAWVLQTTIAAIKPYRPESDSRRDGANPGLSDVTAKVGHFHSGRCQVV